MTSVSTRWHDPEPRWSLDPRVRHLNHGSFGAVPVAVQEEQARLRSIAAWNPVRWFATLPARVGEAREEMADLLRVSRESLAFVQNASAGASVVYQSLMARGPVDVVVTSHGYGAITMGAQRLAARSGGTATTIDIALGATAEEVLASITRTLAATRPTLLVVDQVTSATARAFPVDEICRVARAQGVLTLVDGAHAPGVLADPICREADFWVGNLHKFVCAPAGAAVLVVREPSDALFPLIDSWGSPLPYPQRFDHQGTTDLTSWLVAPFAWRHLDETVGWDAIRSRAGALLDSGVEVVARALEGLVDVPVPDVGQPVGPMRLVGLPAGLGDTHAGADALRVPFGDATGIAMAFTNFEGRGFLRLSSHIYNSLSDYQYLATEGIPLLHQWSQQHQGTSQA